MATIWTYNNKCGWKSVKSKSWNAAIRGFRTDSGDAVKHRTNVRPGINSELWRKRTQSQNLVFFVLSQTSVKTAYQKPNIISATIPFNGIKIRHKMLLQGDIFTYISNDQSSAVDFRDENSKQCTTRQNRLIWNRRSFTRKIARQPAQRKSNKADIICEFSRPQLWP